MSDTAEYQKPLPRRTEENAPFLDGLKAGEIRLQHCGGCGRCRYPAARYCPSCLSDRVEWRRASGAGRLYSYIVVHQLYDRAFKDDLPYNVAVVELDEGPRIVTNIVGCANEDLRIGMAVRAEFVPATPEITLLKFRP
jgi:uncharacterized OB-fold protein